MRKILKTYLNIIELDCNMDMRGYFIITVEQPNIIVKLMNKNDKIIKEFCSTNDE